MASEVSVRELRNHTAAVIDAVRSGERLSLTVEGTPVANIVPHTEPPSPWIAAAGLRTIVEEAGVDAGLLDGLSDVRGQVLNSE